jgi:putative acetyltransferase
MIRTVRTNSENKDFVALVASLDNLLAEIDGREHDFYNQFNKIENIQHVVVVYHNDLPVACGAMKAFDRETTEVKRMFTLEEFRGKGFASLVLNELEIWAQELGFSRCILETGRRLPDAVRLYREKAYQQISNYGQYLNMENSICFEKILNKIQAPT